MTVKAAPDLAPHHGAAGYGHAPVDFRVVARRAEEERASLRQRELELQTSAASSAEERIRIWERRHALRLPTSAVHPLITVIAANTNLSVRAVKAEQQRRSGSRSEDT